MRTRLRALYNPKQDNIEFAVQVHARGQWCWLTENRKLIRHKTQDAAEKERAEMRRRPDPGKR